MSLGYRPTLGHGKRGKREEEQGASSHTNVHAHVHRCKAESDKAMWRKDVISVYRSRLLSHIELKEGKWCRLITIRPQEMPCDLSDAPPRQYIIHYGKTKRSKCKNKEEYSDLRWWDDPEVKGLLGLPCVWFRDYTGTAYNAICSGRHPYMSPLSTYFSYHHRNVIFWNLGSAKYFFFQNITNSRIVHRETIRFKPWLHINISLK